VGEADEEPASSHHYLFRGLRRRADERVTASRLRGEVSRGTAPSSVCSPPTHRA
jgi:hypothetical protein